MKRLLLLFLFLAVTLFAKVDINSADAKTLQSLPGIGPAKAEAIIEWREANGGFQHARDLQSVNGIGPKTYEAIREAVEVGDR
jgi:competence protein ComEA